MQVVIAASVPRFLSHWLDGSTGLGDEQQPAAKDWKGRLEKTALAMNQRIKQILRIVGINNEWQDGRFIENWKACYLACGTFKLHFRDARSPFGAFIKQRWKGWSPDPSDKSWEAAAGKAATKRR